jgi:hypothetical protein
MNISMFYAFMILPWWINPIKIMFFFLIVYPVNHFEMTRLSLKTLFTESS